MMQIFKGRPNTVIKLGGSLFDSPRLADQFVEFLETQQFENPVIIPGGGLFADAIRHLDEVHSLQDEHSHDLGIRTLSLSCHFVAELSPKFELIGPEEPCLRVSSTGKFPVIDTSEVVLKHSPLPASWDVTSDSIAAWLASLHSRSHLVLLKSVDLPPDLTLVEASKLRLVDTEFPNAAAGLQSISWCNFRSEKRELVDWLS